MQGRIRSSSLEMVGNGVTWWLQIQWVVVMEENDVGFVVVEEDGVKYVVGRKW